MVAAALPKEKPRRPGVFRERREGLLLLRSPFDLHAEGLAVLGAFFGGGRLLLFIGLSCGLCFGGGFFRSGLLLGLADFLGGGSRAGDARFNEFSGTWGGGGRIAAEGGGSGGEDGSERIDAEKTAAVHQPAERILSHPPRPRKKKRR